MFTVGILYPAVCCRILRTNNDMISHVSFLAPMASDPNVNTMYYGHANVGNMVNSGVEIIP